MHLELSLLVSLATLALFAECKDYCDTACNALRHQLPASYVTTSGRPDQYWATQIVEIQPACYVVPHTVDQVSTVVKVAVQHKCPFAIRGGGHSDLPGASNLAGGITLDLNHFQGVVLSKDETVASVGPGSNWGHVYSTLDPKNVTAVGGRERTVGVAGLSLGGGISFFSGLHGFACDNVKNYEVVLANGTVAQVNYNSEYKDLYRALRGGGNNFGVVTRFDLDVYKYHLMEGGLSVYNDSAATAKGQVKAFVEFAHDAPSDPKAAMFTSLDYISGKFIWTNGYYYTKPIPTSQVKLYRPFYTKQLNSSLVLSTERTTTHANLSTELGKTQPSGFRQQFHTATFEVNAELMGQMLQIFREEVARALKHLGPEAGKTFDANMAFQPLSKNILQQQQKRGGNVLGLCVEEAPLMLLSMSWPWSSAAEDGTFIGGMNRVVDRSVQAAKKLGVLNEFVYMNYAAPGDAVIAGYGAANDAFLRQVSAKYDPTGVFQQLVPGGFKLME